VAGPIFREITDRIYVRDFQMHEADQILADGSVQAPYSKSGISQALASSFGYLDLPLEADNKGSRWVSTTSTPEGVVLREREMIHELVPNVVDMGLKDAIYLLESKGLKVTATGRGTVRKQSIKPGSLLREGTGITLTMSITEG
jgi:cell division protein FtsI (penicillin-binding protein 3)